MIPDFEGADDIGAILARFVPAARKIMLEHRLVYKELEWSITSLELYLWTGGTWCDPWTDRKAGQEKHNVWYVNRGRNPNYGRIDIAAGNGHGVFAGFLVRELDRRDGSSVALQKIIRGGFDRRDDHDRWTPEELDRICSIDGTAVSDGPLRLVSTEAKSSDVWIGPRVLPSAKNSRESKIPAISATGRYMADRKVEDADEEMGGESSTPRMSRGSADCITRARRGARAGATFSFKNL